MIQSTKSDAVIPAAVLPPISFFDWPEAVDVLRSRVVKITTPTGSGTGFVFSSVPRSKLVVVATAAHVVDNAHFWEQPIRIQYAETDETILLHADERAVILDEHVDTAAVVFETESSTPPMTPIDLTPEGMYLRVGKELGWLGYPALASTTLCFFGGRVSAMDETERTYLIDGVAINGVSGGPAFFINKEGRIVVIGIVSAYIPNRATGETLPGLCIVQDIKQLQEMSKRFGSLEEAKEEEVTPSVPPPPPEKKSEAD